MEFVNGDSAVVPLAFGLGVAALVTAAKISNNCDQFINIFSETMTEAKT